MVYVCSITSQFQKYGLHFSPEILSHFSPKILFQVEKYAIGEISVCGVGQVVYL